MKKIILFICLFVGLDLCAQIPDSVKHIEIISEISDTMFLLNKPDVDIINTTFYKLDCADSLNAVNDAIIAGMSAENLKLESVISEQKSVLQNKDLQITNIQETNKEVISNLEKQVKRANG